MHIPLYIKFPFSCFPSKNFWGLVLGCFLPLESAATDKSDQQCLQYESVFETRSANTGKRNST